ncbi:long-chain fatty acid--CoA ligase [Cytobacillus gottheilii]|uniref:LuxE/PaaK family acyltransferase n=1 Tax=Cytobacillus gottheilii TaxID=859144 RepID=UPI00082C87FC|nr:long-chain fatty acid--CoA ligase [Cytobacillus gottheilii]
MTQKELIASIQQFIHDEHSHDFNELALQLFRYQFEHNLPFQRFSKQKRKTPRNVKNWRDIPSVPIQAFKDVPLSCISTEQAEATFMTSGTTKHIKGKHYHPTLTVFDSSMITNFKKRFMKEQKAIKMGILFPDHEEMPNSSLARYLFLAKAFFGTPESKYTLSGNGINFELLLEELKTAQQSGEAYALLGASFSFVHLIDYLQEKQLYFKLPKGSRILDTGGYKNQSRHVETGEFYTALKTHLGIEKSDCINMYGMTELSTQFYDDGNEEIPSVKSGPHWIRTRVINPLTGLDMPFGENGVLVHYDLANFNSALSILTEDLGVETDKGFQLLGRVQGSEQKGCSLAVDEFLRYAKEES